MSYYELDVTVLSGLSVTVSFNIQPPEPDLGLFSCYVEDINVIAVKGKKLKFNNWVDKRIAKSGDLIRLEQELLYETQYY